MWTKLRGRAQQECKGDWKLRWEVEAEVERWMCMMGAEESATNVYAEVKLEAEYEEVE